jgi:hypothetical protein
VTGAGVHVLSEVRGGSAEDPLGPGDPLEVARLVRRALAAARRRAVDVEALALVADAEPDPVTLARFARRALGPHGVSVRCDGAGEADLLHEARVGAVTALAVARAAGGVAVAVALGPGDAVTVRCVVRDRD